MANSVIKLYYFNVAGRAETIRLLLTVAGKQFEDVRINRDQWMEMKPNSPCGTIPILEIDGRRFGQSRAIASYLATEFNLFGEKRLDGLKIDQIAHTAEDFVLEYGKHFFFAPDAEKKADGEKYLKETAAPRYLGFFEKSLKEEGTGFVAGYSLSLGDIVLYDVCTGFLKPLVEGCLNQFPLVQAAVQNVENDERVKAYNLAKQKGSSG